MVRRVFDGYVRVSRVAGREGESFISPELQRERIEAWAALRGEQIGEWHVDLDVSGARAERPGLAEALARVEAGVTTGVVVAKLDRLARSLPVAFDTISRIERAGGQLVSVEEGIDPTTATGRMMRNLVLLLAEWYRDQIREQWEVARERAVRRGAAVVSTVPTGYQRGRGGRLEPHPEWGPVIREVFERRAAGATWAALARWMNERGVPVQYANGRERTGGRWTGSVVGKLVLGRVYLGEVRHGTFVNAHAHEPLVSPGVWHAAQQARGTPDAPARGEPALLSGLVRCAGCGYAMHRASGRGAGGGQVWAYRCRGGGSGGACPDRAFAYADDLERVMEGALLAHADDLAVRGDQDTVELDQALATLDEAEHALRVFRDDPRVLSALGQDAFVEGLRERARRVDTAREQVEGARLPAAGVPDVVTLRGIWPSLSVVERRRVMTAALDCLVVAGAGQLTVDRVRACWAGLGPEGLPGRGRRGSGVRPIPLDGLPPQTRVTVPS